MSLTLPPLSLYVHLPWCVRKCPYCDFNSHPVPSDMLPQASYVDALLRDLALDLDLVGERPIVSVFFGGGTPSLFVPEEIERFLDGVRRELCLAPDAEITLEANPGTIEHGRFAGYRAAGVNRISLGAQTFEARHLQALGRIHSGDDIYRAVDELRAAGFENFNLDLMYALPEQSPAEALRDVAAAVALEPTHVSHYQLTLEPGTVFYHRPPPLPDTDTAWQMQTECQAYLGAHGYEQYEVSAYARDSWRCRHNVNYWEFGDYVGVGAGAHGKLTDARTGTIVRTLRAKQPRAFLAQVGEGGYERRTIAVRDLPFEYFLNSLRLHDGFTQADFEARTGLSIERVMPRIEHAVRKQLLANRGPGCWRPTDLGQRFLNDLQALFLPESSAA